MSPAAEARVRQAVADLADALLAALRETEARDTGPTRLLDVDEASALLGLGRSRTYVEIAAGRLASLKVGHRRLIAASAVMDYIAQRSPAPNVTREGLDAEGSRHADRAAQRHLP